MASDDISDYLNWLNHEHQIYENYHNHKEMMAWIATAFYAPSIITIGFVVSKVSLLADILLTAGLVIAAYIVLVFINMQFRKRWFASDATAVLMRLIVRLSGSSDNIEYRRKVKLLLGRIENKDIDEHFLPVFIEYIINRLGRKRRLPQFLSAVGHIFTLRLRNLDDRWKTEIPCYTVVLLSTIVAILSLWRYKIFY
jgi:hypothetical protein